MKRRDILLEAIEAVYRTRATDFFRFALAKTGDPERWDLEQRVAFVRIESCSEAISRPVGWPVSPSVSTSGDSSSRAYVTRHVF